MFVGTAPRSDLAERLRNALKAAGVTRKELFESTALSLLDAGLVNEARALLRAWVER